MMRFRVLCVVLAGFVVACGPPPPIEVVNLVSVLDQTSSSAEGSNLEAQKLAESHINEGLKNAGSNFRVQFSYVDTSGSPTVALTRTLERVKEVGAVAIMSDLVPSTVELAKTNYDADPANDLPMAIMCSHCNADALNDPAATNPDMATQEATRNTKKFIFKNICSVDQITIGMVRILLEKGTNGDVNGDGVFKVGVMSYAAPAAYANGLTTALTKHVTALGNRSVVIEKVYHPTSTLDTNTYNWASDLDKLRDNLDAAGAVDGYPDAIIAASTNQVGVSFVKAYVASGATTTVVHFNNLGIPGFMAALGTTLNGQEGASCSFVDQGPSGEKFTQLWKEATGNDVGYRNGNYYDTGVFMGLAVMKAIKDNAITQAASLTADQVRTAIASLNDKSGTTISVGSDEFAKAVKAINAGTAIDYQGASSPMDFDSTQRIYTLSSRVVVENGRAVEVTRYNCIQNAATCPPVQ